MIRIIRLFGLVLILTLSVQGCVSTRDIPTSVYSPPTPDSAAVVYFYRDRTMPTGANLDVKIDGQKIALLPPNSFTWVKVSAGNRLVSVGYPSLPDMSAKSEVQLEAGKEYILKYLSSSGGGTVPIFGPNGAFAGTIQMGPKPWTRLQQEPIENLEKVTSSYRFVVPQTE